MRLADVLEVIPACDKVSIQDDLGLIFYGCCMDFRAIMKDVNKHLLRKVVSIRDGVPDAVVIGLEGIE